MTSLLWNSSKMKMQQTLKIQLYLLAILVISPYWHLDGWQPKGPPHGSPQKHTKCTCTSVLAMCRTVCQLLPN